MINVTAGFLIAVLIIAAIQGIRNKVRVHRRKMRDAQEHDAFMNGMTSEQRKRWNDAEEQYLHGAISGVERVRRQDQIWIEWDLGRRSK